MSHVEPTIEAVFTICYRADQTWSRCKAVMPPWYIPCLESGMRTTQKRLYRCSVRPPAPAIEVEAQSPTLALPECTMPLA